MGQRTTFGDSPADEMPRPQPGSKRAVEPEGSAASTLELLRTLACKSESGGETENTLELLRTLARERERGDPTERTLDLLRVLAHKGDNGERTLQASETSAHATSTWSRRLAAAVVGLKGDARSAAPRRPAAHGERSRQMALIAIAAGAAFAAAAGAAFLLSQSPDRDGESRTEIVAPIAAPAEPAAAPAMAAQTAAQSVQTAMTECDREAEKNPDTMYFLVTPVMPAGDAFRLSAEVREEYDSFTLVTSKATLEGLQDGSFALNARPFHFAIIDSATGKTQTWSAATGVSKFTLQDAAAFSRFRLGFDIPDKGPQWSNEYPRRAGVCYWVNVRFHWG